MAKATSQTYKSDLFKAVTAPHNLDSLPLPSLSASDLYPTIDLTNELIDFELFYNVPLELMLRCHFVPVYERDDFLYLAMADPIDVVAQDILRLHFKRPLRFVGASLVQISAVIEKSESGQKVMDEAGEALRIQVLSEESNDGILDLENFNDKEEAPIIRLVDTAIYNALQRRASDIHMETTGSEFYIKYRIDGSLYQVSGAVDRRFASPIISRIKVMSELDISEKRKPQDGRFKLKVRGRAIDFRVSIMPTVHGEDAVIRILDKNSLGEEFKSLTLDVLGISSDDLARIRGYAKKSYGMFLVTGPTGSGKTTTLYAAISEIRSPEDKLITIEDPVEYQLEGVTQIPVNEKKGLTFAVGLRSILRHDPDKIMVGEIRDSETAQIAIQSALTGHIVFTTIHANHALDVFSRFQYMGVDTFNFVAALNCILAQRLVRVLCTKCKRPLSGLSNLDLLENGLSESWMRAATLFESVGCAECDGTGFHGRQAIIELMGIDDDIRELITNRASVREVKRLAKTKGMHTLRERAIEKVQKGLTTLSEVNKVTSRESI